MCSMLLGLALFAACSSDNDNDEIVTPPQPKSYPLIIEVSENPMIPEGGAASAPASRAPITTISSLNSFNMNYVYNKNGFETGSESATKTTEGKWQNSEGSDKGWPSATVEGDLMVTWYAYTNGTFNLNGGNPYISFEGEEYADVQHDLLVATTANKWSICQGLLSFTFDHACSALRFYVKKSTNLNAYTLKVRSIKLRNIVNQGKYMLTTNTWDIGTHRTEYTLYDGSAVELGSAADAYTPIYGTYGTVAEPYLFLIPQTLSAWNTTSDIVSTTLAYLEIDCTITDSNSTVIHDGTAYIPFAATLEKGTQRDVKINIGKNSLYSGPNTKIIN